MAQSFMAEATTSATEGSSFSPLSIVFFSDLKDRLRQPLLHLGHAEDIRAKSSPDGVSAKFSGGEMGL